MKSIIFNKNKIIAMAIVWVAFTSLPFLYAALIPGLQIVNGVILVFLALFSLSSVSYREMNSAAIIWIIGAFIYIILAFAHSLIQSNSSSLILAISIAFKIIFSISVIFFSINIKNRELLRKYLKFIFYILSVQLILQFSLEPIFNICDQSSSLASFGNNPNYDYQVFSCGVFGFAKVKINLFGYDFVRAQGFAGEPGWLAWVIMLTYMLSFDALSKVWKLTGVLVLIFTFSPIQTGIALLFFILRENKDKTFQAKALALIKYAVCGIIVLYTISDEVVADFYELFISTKFEVSWSGVSSVDQRLIDYLRAYNYFLDNPIFGGGFGVMLNENGINANNFILTILAENGIVGLLVILFLLILPATFRFIESEANVRFEFLLFLFALFIQILLVEVYWNFYYQLFFILMIIFPISMKNNVLRKIIKKEAF